ncbi:FG-GAP-like repeat-containing protein [Dyadobacter sp. 676]|uniref:FG-GAP-like repeat-containing protein n=1 Tax=Dyadobacter sp. 676 TaxID=3088362 RepID=A0AAU8FCE4_9BACT
MTKIYQRAMAVALAGTTLLGAGLWYKHRTDPVPSKPVTKSTGALPTGVSEATLANIRSSLAKQEYHISFDEQKKKLQSPNRRNNIRAYYEPGKLTVETRVDTTGDGFEMELVNEGVFADGKLLYAPEITAKADHHENKVQISHSAFTEEFINNEDGVRQNFIVQTAPEGTRQLQVKMTAKGLKVEQGSGNELHFYSQTSDGKTRNELVYSDLKCWDADKKPLNATLAYVDNRIQISVDVANAVYPVTIDPIIANGTPQNANKVLEINQSYMWLGFSVASAGDVNGDGYSDVIVGAPQYDKGQDNEGAAFVYLGHASGLTLTAVTLECNQANAQMGYSVASAGDFNGDGLSDVLVGIPFYDASNSTYKDAGMARLYYGSAQNIIATSSPKDFLTSNPGDNYGISVATAGDINADGYSDIIIGVHQFDDGENDEGAAMVWYGAQNVQKEKQQLQINQANAKFGYSVAGAGDIDADGYSDIIVGARWYTNGQGQEGEGAVFIYRGSNSGLVTNNPTIIEGNQYNAAMGNKVSSAGDVNGDGYSDVLISAYLYDDDSGNDLGRVTLHLGSATGINTQPARHFVGMSNDERMGSSIACAGDVNGDGYSDILIGAQHWDNGQFNEGGVFIYHGSKNGIPAGTTPASTLESNQGDGWFGTAVASAGDVNGDGYSDILIGCYTFDNGQKDEGHVFVYHGGAEGIGTDDSQTLTNGKTGAQMGLSVASAGDVNADGYGDIVIGAPFFDDGKALEGAAFVYYGSIDGLAINTYHLLKKSQANAYFGGSVAGPGDINGDGFDDVIVGAKNYTFGESEEGAVFVYYGSSSGVDPNAGQTGLQVNKAGAHLGFVVAGAGDVNRDGYADFIAGAPTYANTGNVFLYYGSSQAIGSPVNIPGPQINSHFGEVVSSAGDVNGDGYSDIIAGAWTTNYGQQGEGAAYVYHGSSGAFNTNPAKILESNQIDANFGFSVASAGDANGDGYSDVTVGSRYYDNNESNEGAAFVYYGTMGGISDVAPAPTRLETNVAGAYFGWSVSSAGDVNGDGYSDVIVGAPNYVNGGSKRGKCVCIPRLA